MSFTAYDITTVGFGANGFDTASSLQISMIGAIIVEIILTFVFVYTVLGVTSDEKKSSVAGITIALPLAILKVTEQSLFPE